MKYLFALLLLGIQSILSAQTLLGRVQNSSGEGIAYANVALDGKLITISDADGEFVINGLAEGQELFLLITHLSYLPAEKRLTNQADSGGLIIQMDDRRYMHGEVEIVGVRADARTPFTESTIEREQLERMDVGVDLPLLLDLEPAVVTTSDAGTGIGYTGIRVRGSDATRVNVTINGVPLNDAESSTVFWVNLPDMVASTEDIQIQRGVGTSTNGPGAFGASINMRTSSSEDAAFGRVSAFGGSFKTRKLNVAAGTGLLNEQVSFDVRLSSIQSDGFIDRATADLQGYFLQGAWISEKQSVRLLAFGGNEKTYQAWYGVPAEILDTNRTFNYYTYDNEVDDYGQQHYQLLFDQQLGTHSSFNLTLYRTDGSGYFEQFKEEESMIDYGISPLVLGGDTLSTSDIIRRRWLDNTLVGANLSFTTTWDEKHRLVTGGGVNRYDGAHFGEIIWAQYSNDGNIRDRYYDNDAQKSDANIFAKLTYAVGNRWDLFADMQYRAVGYEFVGVNDDGSELDQSVDFGFFNPKAGFVFRPKHGLKYYASVAVGNKEPNRNDYTESAPGNQAKSESMLDYELGMLWKQANQALGINLYYMDYTDQLVLTGQLNDVGGPLRVNVPESFRAGIELSWSKRFSKNLRWNGNIALSRNRILNYEEFVDDWDSGAQQSFSYTTTDIAFSPSVVGSSELAYRFWDRVGKGNAEVALVSKYVGEQYLDNSSNAAARLDKWWVHDFRFNWNMTSPKGFKKLALTIVVRNLLDELYESNGWSYAYLSGGQRNYLLGYYPQAGTNVLGGVTLDF
jgi:iron complex outermembrane receptor protein